MNKRKLLLVALSLCMVAILAMGGTLAYLTDDEKVTNTFTLGDIDINIEEYSYVDGKVVNYVDGVKLNPIDNDQGIELFNKMVRTYNTSKSENDAYIRTIVLLEANDLLDSTYVNEGNCDFLGLHVSHDTGASADGFHPVKEYTHLSNTVEINGEDYWVVAYVAADEEAIPYGHNLSSLAGVWVDKNITSDQIKGWNGEISVLVYSQAIQAEGLTHEQAMTELGAIDQDNLSKWFAAADKAEINDYAPKAN